MAALTELSLALAIEAYIVANKISASTYTKSEEALTGLVNKFIAEEVEIVSSVSDPLSMFDKSLQTTGADLEGFFKPLSIPTAYDPAAADGFVTVSPNLKKFYSYPQGEQRFQESWDDERAKRAVVNNADLSKITAAVMRALSDSKTAWKFRAKMEVLRKYRHSADITSGQIVQLARPTDSATATKYVSKVREYATKMKRLQSKTNALGEMVQSNPANLVLLIDSDVNDKIVVESLASAYNRADANFNVRVVEIGAFEKVTGTAPSQTVVADDIHAVLLDEQTFASYPITDRADSEHIGCKHADNFYEFYNVNIMIASMGNIVYFVDVA